MFILWNNAKGYFIKRFSSSKVWDLGARDEWAFKKKQSVFIDFVKFSEVIFEHYSRLVRDCEMKENLFSRFPGYVAHSHTFKLAPSSPKT